MAQYDLGKVSIRPRGAYAANTNYEFLDSVQNLGGSWLALAASKDVQPGVTAGWQNYWMMITRGIKTIVGSSPADGQTQITITFTDGATATYTYNNEVLADGSVTRTKLAMDALISPIINLPPTSSIMSADVGKTLRFSNGNQDFVLNVVKDDRIPVGATYAIFRYAAKSNKIVFGNTVRVTFMGNSNYVAGPTFTIPEAFGQIAIMKFASDNTYDYWHVSGPAEVV